MATGYTPRRPARCSPRGALARALASTSPAGLLCAAGGLALVIGTLVYLVDRDPARAMALPAFAVRATGPLFGAAGGWLPSFVHVFAFSLFAAAAWPQASRPAYGACTFWWAVDLAFEAVQQPQWRAALATALPSGVEDFAPAGWVARYAQQGRFDPADLLAITAGALAAAAVLFCVHSLRETPHAC